MTHADRIATIQAELQALLEVRVATLLGQIKAVQELTAQLAQTTQEIERQGELAEHLQALRADNSAARERLRRLHDGLDHLRSVRDDVLSSLESVGRDLAKAD